MVQVTIDRFEGNIAVCEKEDGSFIDMDRDKLPEGVKAGDVILIQDGKATIDQKTTDERKQRISKFMEDLWE